MTDLEGFRAELNQAGIPFTGQFICDDRVHRYKTAGDKQENSWFAIHQLNDLYVGIGGCWKRNIQIKWTSRQRKDMSREDWNASAAAWKDLEAKRAREEALAKEKAKERCRQWMTAWKRPEADLYCITKGVGIHGPCLVSEFDLYPEWLALPLTDITGTVHSFQFIDSDGTKKFLYQGRIQGCFYQVSSTPGGPILICEGYATGASLFEATGWTVIAGLNCGNLLLVAQAFRAQYPERTIVICADNDIYTEGNPGLTKATAAAKAIKAHVAVPEFSDSVEGKPTDFNDLHRIAGINAVALQVYQAFPKIATDIGLLMLPPLEDPTELIRSRYLCEGGGMLFNGSTGTGKCLKIGTEVLMFDGTLRPVERVRVDDLIMGPDSQPRRVLSTCSGEDEMFEVSQKRRAPYVVNSQHVLTLKMTNEMSHGRPKKSNGQVLDIELQTYLKQGKNFKHCAKGLAVPADWPLSPVPLPPYFFGIWLGDGTGTKPQITNPDPEILAYISDLCVQLGMLEAVVEKDGCSSVYLKRPDGRQGNLVTNALRALGVFDNKHIPLIYKANSRAVRLELLAGLIDSDGFVANKCAEISSCLEVMANDIAFVARSLGFRATIAKEWKSCQTGAAAWYWRVMISGDLSCVPMKVERKKIGARLQKKDVLVSGIKVKPVGRGQYAGFTLTGDGRFLLGDFTVTHNSSWALQQAACFNNGLPFFGIRPAKRLRIVLIQVENDEGDVAQVRDSVCTGLGLTQEQRAVFFTNCKVHTLQDGSTGEKFCKEVVRPLLDLHAPHLLMIDPALAVVGGNVKEQENVSAFLRAYLTPELLIHRCGCMLFHHTNKPLTGKDKPNWVNGELAYLGSGSAEWANWARAILSMQSFGKTGYYKLHAAKRGARLGWKDESGQILYEKYIAWAKDGGIYWRDPSPDEINDILQTTGGDGKERARKRANKIPQSFKSILKDGSLTKAEWALAAQSKGYSRSRAYVWSDELVEAGEVFLLSNDRYSLILPKGQGGMVDPGAEQAELVTEPEPEQDPGNEGN